jgi:hypothetical protein
MPETTKIIIGPRATSKLSFDVTDARIELRRSIEAGGVDKNIIYNVEHHPINREKTGRF